MERSPYSEETTLLLREAGIDKGMTEREEAEMNIERVEIMHEAGEISTAEFHDYIAQFKDILLQEDFNADEIAKAERELAIAKGRYQDALIAKSEFLATAMSIGKYIEELQQEQHEPYPGNEYPTPGIGATI